VIRLDYALRTVWATDGARTRTDAQQMI